MPPSVRFLGRRVYLEVVVLLACLWALSIEVGADVVALAVPARTTRRWLAFWSSTFPSSPLWAELRARFAPPAPAASSMPRSFLERLAEELGPFDAETVLVKAARLLAPMTTQSCPDSARFVWAH